MSRDRKKRPMQLASRHEGDEWKFVNPRLQEVATAGIGLERSAS